jgi:sugar porter (SP) family MFS transporter
MRTSRNKAFFYFITISAALGGFLFGYDTAVISGTISLVKTQFGLNTIQEGWFVSSALIGCIAGASIGGELSDRFGRKPVLILAGLLFLISALGCAMAGAFTSLVIYRIIGGLGVGIASMVSPLYISEVSPAKSRGKMVALYQFAITIGILTAYFANASLLNFSTKDVVYEGMAQKIFKTEIWRAMLGSESFPAFLFMVVMLLVPFSPRWLMTKNKHARARNVLNKINIDDIAPDQQLEDINHAIENEPKGKWPDLLKKGIRIAVFAGVALAIFSQITGINAIIYYGPRIFEEAGFKLSDALGGQVAIGTVNVLATIVAILYIDRLGRKKLMVSGVVVMFISLIIVGILFTTGNTQSSALLIFILIYIMAYAIGYGPVIWVLLSEIYPTKIRGRAMSVATLTIWIGTAIIGQVVPWMLVNLSPAGTFYVFAICCIPVIFILRVVPETKGRTLEEIERLWNR